VAGHHGGGGEAVGHARGELPDTVAARGVPQQIDLVRVHAAEGDVVIDEPLEQGIDMRLMPEVPGVGRGPGAT
jgi:hypothetical protein